MIIPFWLKIVGPLAALALVVAGVMAWGNGRYRDGVKDENARLAAKALKIKQSTDLLTARIAAALREKNDAEVRRIDAVATDLLVRGAGRASCSGITASPGRRNAPDRPGNVAVDQVPDRERVELIAVPFAGAVSFARQHDLCRAESLAWRGWYGEVLKVWPR